MCKVTLQSARQSLDDFVAEARSCASEGRGFASMLTIFPVLLAVGEADTSEEGMRKHIRSFVNSYGTYRDWLVHEGPDLSPDQIVDFIYDLRNALAHNASTPERTYLVQSATDAKPQLVNIGQDKFLGVKEFVEAVNSYVHGALKRKPEAIFDHKHRTERGPATAGTFRGVPMSGHGEPQDKD
jgi:hypothetical protein